LNGKEFFGRVKSIYPATGAKFSLLPPDNATGNFTKIIQRIPVVIEFDNNQESAANLIAGMSSVVSVKKK
jgi:membrane fusion protein, multidrug efflux system